jgi:iron complex outermembrane receptor protein
MDKKLLKVAFDALRLALVTGLGVGFLAAQTTTTVPTTTTKKDVPETQVLEKFEVTGSRVKRLDVETPQPVVTYTAQMIEDSGYKTVGEFVQSLPFNSGSANSLFQGSSFTRGAVTANPRGLGSNRFLTLVNGRRAVTYALTNSANQSIFDFNSIPNSAIDSIEFLKDGASAIYGSDAITGVLNIKLKKNYTGLRTELYVGNTLGHDTLTKSASILAGAQTGKVSIFVTASYQGGNSSYLRDYDRSKTTDYSSLGANKGANLNSSANYPANLTLTAAQATAAGLAGGSGSYVLTGGKPTTTPTKSQFARVTSIPNENRYDFAQTYQLNPDYDYVSTYSRINYDFSDKLSAFAEFTLGNNITKYGFTPSVIQSTQNAGTGPTGLLNVPANNPYNPLGIDLTNFLYRTSFGPPRKFDTESTGANYLVGLKGNINADWSWELGSAYGYGVVSTTTRNQIRAIDLQNALNGTTRATALNPFGPSDNQALVNGLFTISNASNKIVAYGTDLTVGGNISQFSLPGGEIGVAAGAELRKEKLDTRPDTAAYVGSGGGLPLTGSRTIKSAYAEVSLPVLKSLEFQIAGRHEQYSDFGKTNKPKFGGKLRIPENNFIDLVFRASYSKSFKAPDLGRLYASQTVGFSSTVLSDPLRPQDPATQLRIVTGGNPNLKPEEGRIQYLGTIIELPKSVKNPWLKGLSLAVDYFDYRIDNVISTPSSTFLLSTQGRAQFPNAIIRDNSTENPGPIQRIFAVPVNLAQQSYKGFDFELTYKLPNTRIGNFGSVIRATYLKDIASDSGLGGGNFHNAGLYNNPRLNMTGSVNWRLKNWGAAVYVNRTGQYFNDGYTATGWGENASTLVNPSISYRGLWNSQITVGASNVFGQEPPINGRETTGFDPGTYGNLATGRFLYVRVSKEF